MLGLGGLSARLEGEELGREENKHIARTPGRHFLRPAAAHTAVFAAAQPPMAFSSNGMIVSGLGVLLEELDGFLTVQKVRP